MEGESIRGRNLKTIFKSAVCVILPQELWGPVQEIRKEHDKAYERWPPHINFLFPFISDQYFVEAAQILTETLANVPPFVVRFKELSYFEQSKAWTVHLKPTTEKDASGKDPLIELQKLIQSQFPYCDQLSTRSPDGFHPHLTVAQFPKVNLLILLD